METPPPVRGRPLCGWPNSDRPPYAFIPRWCFAERSLPVCTNRESIALFKRHGIRVIRLGLHASKDVEENYIAGAYHPALMELCQSRIMLRRMNEALDYRGGESIRGFAVNPAELSKAIGQKRCNLNHLRRRIEGAVIIADPEVPEGYIKLIYN